MPASHIQWTGEAEVWAGPVCFQMRICMRIYNVYVCCIQVRIYMRIYNVYVYMFYFQVSCWDPHLSCMVPNHIRIHL